MIKNRLKELEIKITELADYLQISRPTLYKFIESYDEGNKKDIPHSIKALFDYIDDNNLIGKRNVINYILTKMGAKDSDVTDDSNEYVLKIKEYIKRNPHSEKTQFLVKCVTNTKYDTIIHYLIDIEPLLTKKKLLTGDVEKLSYYKKIISIYSQSIKEDK